MCLVSTCQCGARLVVPPPLTLAPVVVTCPGSGCVLLSWHHQVCGWLSAGESQPLPGPCRRCPYHPHQPCERKPSSGVIKSASKKGSKGCLGARIRRCTRTDGQGRRTGAESLRATGNLWRCERSVFAPCALHWGQGEMTNRDAAQDGWRSGLQTLDNYSLLKTRLPFFLNAERGRAKLSLKMTQYTSTY